MKTTPDFNEKNAVDELFRKALANHEAEASATAHQKWQAEMARLNKDRRRGWIWWTLPALLVAAGLGGYRYMAGIENTPSGDRPTQPVISTEKFENAKQPSEPLPHLTTEKATEEVSQKPITTIALTSAKREQPKVVTMPQSSPQEATVSATANEQLQPVAEMQETVTATPEKEEQVQLEVVIRLGNEASAKSKPSAEEPAAEDLPEEGNLKRLWKRLNGKGKTVTDTNRRVEHRILGIPADSLFKKKDKRKTQD